jgi:hypothetical protein
MYNIKFLNAQQAKPISKLKNHTTGNLLKANAGFWFNKYA